MSHPHVPIRRVFLSALALVAVSAVLAPRPAAAADAHHRSKAPRAWRPDQLQRLSPTRRPVIADPARLANAVAMVMAGDATGDPPDSPFGRVDDNSLASPYAGVCSLMITRPDGTFMCSGAPISPHHVLTAAHCFDADDDGDNDATHVSITFNHTGSGGHQVFPVGVARVDLHPDYTGFANPDLDDDLAIVTLVEPFPTDIPIYPPFRGILEPGEILTIVGYGNSGHGDVGVTVAANRFVKRVGVNAAEQFFLDDEGGGALEIWEADFDGPTEATSCFGGLTLGNDQETGVASGDSGGPSLVSVNGVLHVWGVNTFGESCVGSLFRFGSTSGGMVVNAYLPWIDSIVECGGNCHDCNDNGVADGLDVALGDSVDDNGDGIPDECNALEAGDIWAHTNSYLGSQGYSFDAGGVVATMGAQFDFFWGARFGADRLMYIAADANPSPFTVDSGIFRFVPATGEVADELISEADGLSRALDLEFGADGLIYVLNYGTDNSDPSFITRHDPFTGDFIDVFVPADVDANGGITRGSHMKFGPDGHLYVADGSGTALVRFDGTTGAYLGRFAEGGPALGANANFIFRDGILWMARFNTGQIVRYDATSGAYLDTFLELPDDPPSPIWDMHFGVDDTLYVMQGNADKTLARYDPLTGQLLETVLDDSVAHDLQRFAFVPELDLPDSADVNGDGIVGVDDLVAVIAAWGPCPPGPCPADLNGTGSVCVDDLVLVMLNWD